MGSPRSIHSRLQLSFEYAENNAGFSQKRLMEVKKHRMSLQVLIKLSAAISAEFKDIRIANQRRQQQPFHSFENRKLRVQSDPRASYEVWEHAKVQAGYQQISTEEFSVIFSNSLDPTISATMMIAMTHEQIDSKDAFAVLRHLES
ncbi:putative FAD-dependent monooxygenase [Fusarium oxysporum f. sp. albedinis]|nr:putative FAD-dependent monooxygenase [Fusarium oxysporum f. sp. albedinis]